MDLTNTVCIIEYILPKDDTKVPYIYIVPYYDTRRFIKENKIVFPWVVGDAATLRHGTLEYAIRFYKVEGYGNDAKLIYNLNTLPAKAEILPTIASDGTILEIPYDMPIAARWEHLVSQIDNSKTVWRML
jgi:hypothetical protein